MKRISINRSVMSVIVLCFIALFASGKVIKYDRDSDQEGEIRLIVRGDDMGFCHAANIACIQSYRDGIMRSVEVMVPGPWFNEAVDMLKNNPGLDVGIHLTVTSEWDNLKWGPVASKSDVPSLVDKDGYFYQRDSQEADYPPGTGFKEANPKPAELEIELRAQIERALSKIPNVTHLSAHMGAPTSTPELRAVVEKLSREYKLSFGVPGSKGAGGFVKSTSLTEIEIEKNLVEVLEKLEPGNLYLLIEHPGIDCPEMKGIGHIRSRFVAMQRGGVTKAFTSDWVKDVIRKKGIKIVSYGDMLKK